MALKYPIPASPHQFEFEIKRSQFISYTDVTPNRAAAEAFLRSIRALHPQARHICWAYIAGSPNSTEMSMSDDGEPSGTAGRPMLNVLQHSGLGDITVAVVRYFGGIKLGTGGLQRAYSDAVTGLLSALPTKLKVPRVSLLLKYEYAQESLVRHVISHYDCESESPNYTMSVSHVVHVAEDDCRALQDELINSSAGSISIEEPAIANESTN